MSFFILCEREYDDQYKTIVVRIKEPCGLRLNFDIDGSSSLGDSAFILPWHMDYQSDNLLLLVPTAFGGAVNKRCTLAKRLNQLEASMLRLAR